MNIRTTTESLAAKYALATARELEPQFRLTLKTFGNGIEFRWEIKDWDSGAIALILRPCKMVKVLGPDDALISAAMPITEDLEIVMFHDHQGEVHGMKLANGEVFNEAEFLKLAHKPSKKRWGNSQQPLRRFSFTHP